MFSASSRCYEFASQTAAAEKVQNRASAERTFPLTRMASAPCARAEAAKIAMYSS